MASIAISAPVVSYSVEAFNALPEFEDSKQRFPEREYVLDSLGTIIREHGVQKFIGAALIHKHFHLNQRERVVEHVTEGGSTITARADISEDEVTPYLWHVSRGTLGLQWTPVEFVLSASVPDDVRAFAISLPRRTDLLDALASVLTTNNAENVFGLALLHRQNIQFDRDSQVLLETPGDEERSLRVLAVNPASTRTNDWTQTYWHFDVDANNIVNGCSQHGCAGHCTSHEVGR